MNILICDDVNYDALRLKDILYELLPNACIKVFNSGSDALVYIDAAAPSVELCFLDIMMPEMDGVSLAQKMRKKGFGGQIVFLTNSNDFAAQSYGVKAFSYLLKPPDKTQVAKVLSELETALKTADTAGLPVKTKTISMFILFRNISHIEIVNRTVHFRLINGEEIAVNIRFLDIAPVLLADRRFGQCHRSFLVNMHDIYKVQGNTVIMNNGKQIQISRNYANFKSQYIDYMLGG